MKDMHDVTIEFPVHFTRGAAGRKALCFGRARAMLEASHGL